MTDEEKANIKYRLSNIGEQVGELALKYISELEKENKIKEEIIIGEQKENAELKEEIESLANINIKAQNIIAELKAQIERMKNCQNCKHSNDSNINYYCEDCKRFAYETDIDKWELAE